MTGALTRFKAILYTDLISIRHLYTSFYPTAHIYAFKLNLFVFFSQFRYTILLFYAAVPK